MRVHRQLGCSRAWLACNVLLMPRGNHFFCFAKKNNKKKAGLTFATIGLFPRFAAEKAERKKLASLKQFFVLIAFSAANLGANQPGPRSAVGATS